MLYDLSRAEREHRAINAEKTTGALIPKRCACSKPITARQQNQHGACEHCRLTAGLAEGDLDILRHMLRIVPICDQKPGIRNQYLCNVQDRPAMKRLVAAGLVREGDALLKMRYYHATKDGCRAAGLDRAGIVRALGAVL